MWHHVSLDIYSIKLAQCPNNILHMHTILKCPMNIQTAVIFILNVKSGASLLRMLSSALFKNCTNEQSMYHIFD